MLQAIALAVVVFLLWRATKGLAKDDAKFFEDRDNNRNNRD